MIRYLLAGLLAASGLALAAPAFAAKPQYLPSPCLGDLGADASRVSCLAGDTPTFEFDY